MRTPLAGCLVLVLGHTANAAPPELAVGELQLDLDPRRELTDDDSSTNPYYRYAAFAQLTGGGQGGGDVGAGASAAVGGIGCDIVAGSMQGRLRFDASYAGEATYSLCLSRVLLTAVFDGRRGIGIEPALDARRSLWARHYDESYDRIEIGFGEWGFGASSRHTIMVMALGHGVTQQDDRTVKTLDLDVALYRYRHLGRHDDTISLDAIALTSEALKAGTDDRGGVASAFMPVRLRYETREQFVAAQVGWGFSGGSITASSETQVNGQTTSSWTETIDSTGLPQMTILVGDVEAGVRRDRLEYSARLARSFYPTFDGNIAREARLAGLVSYTPGRTRRTKLTLSPFAARTRTWTRDAGSSRDVSAGASLYVGRQLTHELRVDAIGQAGMSPYARIDERSGVPASTLGGQVLVAVTGRVADLKP